MAKKSKVKPIAAAKKDILGRALNRKINWGEKESSKKIMDSVKSMSKASPIKWKALKQKNPLNKKK